MLWLNSTIKLQIYIFLLCVSQCICVLIKLQVVVSLRTNVRCITWWQPVHKHTSKLVIWWITYRAATQNYWRKVEIETLHLNIANKVVYQLCKVAAIFFGLAPAFVKFEKILAPRFRNEEFSFSFTMNISTDQKFSWNDNPFFRRGKDNIRYNRCVCSGWYPHCWVQFSLS